MQSRGFAPEHVLARSGIDVLRLSDPSYLVELDQHQVVIANMLRLTGQSGLGFDIGMQTLLTDLGIVGYAMSSSTSMGQALGLFVQFSNSPLGFPFKLQLLDIPHGSGWGVQFHPGGIGPEMFRFFVEEALGMGFCLGPLLMSEQMELEELRLGYPAPPHRQRYEDLFRCPIHFEADCTRAIAKAPHLHAPVRSHDSEMRELCLRQCSMLMQQSVRRGAIGSRLRSALRARGTIPSLDEAAASLALSPRSLRRHLRAENTSFQEVLDEFRRDLCCEYLTTGAMSIKEIAYLLGFSEADALRRAFKKWTGHTIGGYLQSEAPVPGTIRQ